MYRGLAVSHFSELSLDYPCLKLYYKTKSKEPKKEQGIVARPPAKELTERELEVMHVFWERGELTAAEIRESLAGQGRELAYTTVATLIRILFEKGFLVQVNDQRPFRFKPARPFEDVSKSMIGDMVDRLFGGSREQLLLRMFDGGKMTRKERQALESLLREDKS